MTTSIAVDGVPYLVQFSGTIDIQMLGEHILIVMASDDAKVWSISVDACELERRRLKTARLDAQIMNLTRFFRNITDPHSSMGGSRVRSGYD